MKNIISKLLAGSISKKELVELKEWLNDSKNQSILESYIKDYHDLNLAMLQNNVDAAYNKVMNRIERKEKPVKRLIPNWSKYAAAIILLFGLGFLYQQGFFSSPVENIIVPKDAITLKLYNGNIKVIKEDGTTEVMDSNGNTVGTQQGTQLVYTNGTASEKLTYNTLTVPYGKRFNIILSDSTHVILNAGTSLKYPVKFIKGKNREVFLAGEAFFEVAKDAAHPFIVNADGLNIRVLGTKFNVSAYSEDSTTNTVLVEGSVALYQKGTYDSAKKTFLTPGHLASLNKANKDIAIENAETSLYTAWINGNIILRHVPFKNIIKKLERHYNVVIINNYKALDEELFTANFDNSTLEQVLKTFKDNYGIEYTIDGDKITINPKIETDMK